MHSTSVSLLSSLILLAAVPAFSGESPYNPGAAPNSSVTKPMSYYCTAQGNGESKWYVTGFESAPNVGASDLPIFQGNASVAFTEYMKATYARKALYAHCVVGESQGLRPSWEQMQANPLYKETVHLNWRYEKTAAPAAGNTSSN